MVDGLPGELMARARVVRKLELEHALTLCHQEEVQPVPVSLQNQEHARVNDNQIMVK